MARDRYKRRCCPNSEERSHSEWRMLRCAGPHAGVSALAWAPGAVRDAASASRRNAATDGLHLVDPKSPGSGVELRLSSIPSGSKKLPARFGP